MERERVSKPGARPGSPGGRNEGKKEGEEGTKGVSRKEVTGGAGYICGRWPYHEQAR